jgi:predicted DsbA family dithiol-disulfide isomerase
MAVAQHKKGIVCYKNSRKMNSIRIDFVSDVACPWCAVGASALQAAISELGGEVSVDLHCQPFELNPAMGPLGEDVGTYLHNKYGSTPAQQAEMRERIAQRGAQSGFVFKPEGRGRIWNTFDAHRLLHWAAQSEQQTSAQWRLKMALLQSYHAHGHNMSDHTVLLACVQAAGLDVGGAQAVLASDQFATEVRQAEQHWQQAGINAVPAVVINGRYLISGGQPQSAYVAALRKMAAGDPS